MATEQRPLEWDEPGIGDVKITELLPRDELVRHADKLELALYRIAGHGNITGQKAREIAAEALGITKPE